MEYQLKVYDDDDVCVETSTGYGSQGDAEREALTIMGFGGIDRVEVYTDRFRRLVTVV